MGLFDAPYPGDERTKNSQWCRAAPRGMRSPDHLWGEYWQRFNLFPMPIFDKEDYFRTAMTIAKDAKSKQDFERKFEEVNKRRLEELQSLLRDIFWNTNILYNFNCLERFVRVLGDYALEQKAEAEEAAKAAEAEAAEEAKAVMEKQKYMEENSPQEWGGIFVEDETETLIREISRSPSAEFDYEEYPFVDLRNVDGSQLPYDDIDWGYRSRQKNDTFMATNYGSWKPASDDNTPNSDDDDSQDFEDAKETNCEPLKPALDDNTHNSDDDDDEQNFEDANETVATEDGLRRPSSVLSKSSSSNSAKKRVRFSGEDEDVSIPEPKRRKLEDPLSPTPTSPTTYVPSSIKQVADASVSRKRSRPDEEEEEDNGYKRQKTENVPQPPSLISPASSTEDGSASHLAQGTLEKVPKERTSNNGRRKQRIQKSTSQTSRAKPPRNTLNTRSSRRATSSTLWELDSSGKSRLV